MFALLNVYKPRGMSSFDVIRLIRRVAGRGLKAGHAGTLDPLAEGVLVVCLGPATRLADVVQAQQKEYVTVAELGVTSATDDAEGPITPTPGAVAPTREQLDRAAAEMVGTIRQVPPAHSAVKVDGRRAYKIARAGGEVVIAPRPVEVHALEVVRYDWPEVELRVVCGSGTYIRSIVRDLGAALGVGGYCRKLVRTRIGPFTAEGAAAVERIEAEGVGPFLIDPIEAFAPAARVCVSAEEVATLALGQAVRRAEIPPAAGTEEYLAAVAPDGTLAAMVRFDAPAGALRPVKVFADTRHLAFGIWHSWPCM